MSTFTIKKGDLVPAITATLMQAVGSTSPAAIDLTTATGVKFAMRNRSTGTIKVDAAATVVTAAAGTVKYQWIAADVDTVGDYDAEWQITWVSGRQTVPGAGYDTIRVTADIAT